MVGDKKNFEVLRVVSTDGVQRVAMGIDVASGELCVGHKPLNTPDVVSWSILPQPFGLTLLLGLRDYHEELGQVGTLPGAVEECIRRLGGAAVLTPEEHLLMAQRYPGYNIFTKRKPLQPEAMQGLKTGHQIKPPDKPRHLSLVSGGKE